MRKIVWKDQIILESSQLDQEITNFRLSLSHNFYITKLRRMHIVIIFATENVIKQKTAYFLKLHVWYL